MGGGRREVVSSKGSGMAGAAVCTDEAAEMENRVRWTSSTEKGKLAESRKEGIRQADILLGLI